MTVILYGVNLSTFTRKVRLALLEKGIDYRLETTPMGSPKIRALHPLGKIPVLEDAGVVIADSSVIIAYLERAYTDTPLYPANAADLARALWLEEYADTRVRDATLPWFAENIAKAIFQAKPADASVLVGAASLRDETFDYLEKELKPEAGFAVGKHLSVADIALGAQLITYRQGGGEFDAGVWPKLARYALALEARLLWTPIVAEEDAALAAAQARLEGAR